MMNKRKSFVALVLVLVLSLVATSVFAALTEKQSTKRKGATTVTWDSSFVETEYTLERPLTVGVDWIAGLGSATFNSFEGKKKIWTPKGVNGAWSVQGTNPVQLTVTFTDLHYDAKRQCFIGNGHFKLYLNIDKDGLPGEETIAGYGVNVHVEQSASNGGECPPDTGGGGGGKGKGKGHK
ncbi:MAG: hypothetical protein ACE5E7_02405 [Anaerolineae bacterium]